MELISCTASVSQLVVYLHSSAASLQRLYNRLAHEDSIYRDEATNIRLLLHILQRLSGHNLDDNSPVFPVLISISGIACQVLNLLQPKRFLGISWTSITSQDKIASAFETLNKKRELLHFHISQKHQDDLADLKKTIESSLEISATTTSAKESAKGTTPPDHKNAPPIIMPHRNSGSDFVVQMNNSRISGKNSIRNSGKEFSARVCMDDAVIEASGSNDIQNETRGIIPRHRSSTAAHRDPTSTPTTTMSGMPEISRELQLLRKAPGLSQVMSNLLRSLSRPSNTAALSEAGDQGINNRDDNLENTQNVQMGRVLPERR